MATFGTKGACPSAALFSGVTPLRVPVHATLVRANNIVAAT